MAHTLYKAFADRINGFHRSQAQNYALSENPIYKTHVVYPDLQIQYTNIHGQEILEVRVPTHIAEEIIKRKGDQPYDYILVEFDLPGASDMSVNLSAWMAAPPLAPYREGGAPSRSPTGMAWSLYEGDDWTDHPMLRWPPGDPSHPRYTSPVVQSVGGGVKLTLLIDVSRKLRNVPILVDIHSSTSTNIYKFGTCEFVSQELNRIDHIVETELIQNFVLDALTERVYDPNMSYSEYAAMINQYAGGYEHAEYMDIQYNQHGNVSYSLQRTINRTYLGNHDGVHGRYPYGYDRIGTIQYFYVYDNTYEFVPGGNGPVDATVRAVGIFGEPNFPVGRFINAGGIIDGGNCPDYTGGATDYTAWYDLPSMQDLGQVTLPPYETGPIGRMESPYICSIGYIPPGSNASVSGPGSIYMSTSGPTLTY